MASVHNSKAKFYDHVPQSGEEANHSIESEADVFIKTLSQKQLDTNITLEQQLSYQKEFELRQVYQPEEKSTAGVVTLQNFEKLCASEEIDRNDETRDNTSLESKYVSRHVEELALAVKPNSLETKLLKFAISCNAVGQKQSDIRPSDHPINQLKTIEYDRFGHLSDDSNPTQTAQTILRKRRQLLESISKPIEIKRKPVVSKGRSLWDVTETSNNRRSKHRLYTCPEQRLFTIRDQKIVEMNANDDQREERAHEVVKDKDAEPCVVERLSEDEIKKLPKFCNYDRGTPNETLYLKNLSPSVTEEDLSSLFAEYQKPERPSITYRLLKNGKMRGQAFVNFYCLETAERALEGLNGTFLRGKPIIIQFSSSAKKGNAG